MPYLSIVIPAYNEADRLPETLTLIEEFLRTFPHDVEVMVVDDGSKDNTVALVKGLLPTFRQLRLIENAQNKGKGGVVRQGMLEAKGEYRLFTDADNSTPIGEIAKLLPYIPEYDVVIGSRYLNKDSIKVPQPLKRKLISRSSNWAIQRLVLPGIKDTQCGFKLFSAQAAEKVFTRQSMKGWSFDVELLTIARQQGLKIKEVAIDWYDAKNSSFPAARGALPFLRDLGTIFTRARHKEYQ